MPIYSQTDFCSIDQGLDYLFGRMSATYGAAFSRNWDNIDPSLVRQTWGYILDNYATYRPCMDFALQHMDKTFPPSALAIRDLCSQAGGIPDKPHSMIEQQPTEIEKVVTQKAKDDALAMIKEFVNRRVM